MKNLFCIFLMLTCSAGVQAAAVENYFIAKYIRDFDNGKDLTKYFTQRPQFYFGHHFEIVDNATQASEMMLRRRKKLEALNYGMARVEETKVLAAMKSYTLITARLKRTLKDGKPMDTVCNTFGLFKTKFGYRILSWQQTKPNNQGACNGFSERSSGAHSNKEFL